MSSILTALGAQSDLYAPLPQLAPESLKTSRNIVLIVIDGLGYEYLTQHGAGGTLYRHLKARITSVFPTTTASAITTFLTGTAPQQHALTGWFTYFKELGTVATVLPFIPRYGGVSLAHSGIDARWLFDQPSVFERIQVQSFVVLPQRIIDSAYSRAHIGPAERRPYTSLGEFFQNVRDILREDDGRKYVYAYWPDFDGLAHKHGIHSTEVGEHFLELDTAFADFLESIQGSQTTVIVTGDHGIIDSTPGKQILLEDHPNLADMLILPLCGEPRVAYCYIHPHQQKRIEDYVETQLGDCASLLTREALIEGGYFGLGEPHPRLADRVGHYALVMKDRYVIKDWVLGEHAHTLIGVHGGLSEQELYVPLLIARP